MKKKIPNDSGWQREGRLAFERGEPISACPHIGCRCCGGGSMYGVSGGENAWMRGWRRARMAAQKIANKAKPPQENSR